MQIHVVAVECWDFACMGLRLHRAANASLVLETQAVTVAGLCTTVGASAT